jgi:AAA domain
MASGRNLLGVEPVRPMRAWYWNGEDPQEELERRVLAICLLYGIDRVELEKNLFLDSGRDTEIIIATQTRTAGTVIAIPVEDALTAALIDGTFDALILDPAVSIHRVSENDNVAIDAVFKTLGRIAGKADIAVEAVHHTRKLGGAAATIEDARGASAQTAAARNVQILNRMTKDEAARAGIEDGEERFYFRSDSDGNLSPPSATEWFHLKSVGLGNGSGGLVDDQDYVGVVIPWKWPNAFEGVTVTDLRRRRPRLPPAAGGRARKRRTGWAIQSRKPWDWTPRKRRTGRRYRPCSKYGQRTACSSSSRAWTLSARNGTSSQSASRPMTEMIYMQATFCRTPLRAQFALPRRIPHPIGSGGAATVSAPLAAPCRIAPFQVRQHRAAKVPAPSLRRRMSLSAGPLRTASTTAGSISVIALRGGATA